MATFLIGFDILEDAFFWSAHILNFQDKIQVQKFMHVWMKFHGSAQKQGYNIIGKLTKETSRISVQVNNVAKQAQVTNMCTKQSPLYILIG